MLILYNTILNCNTTNSVAYRRKHCVCYIPGSIVRRIYRSLVNG